MLTIGQTISHYSVLSRLGKGGMGEVYGAKDQILGRDVAIKVLPDEFARDADRVARFQREAKLLASLNHPNIAAIHGLEEADGTHFLVLELIEGDTLADRIKGGAIPVEESLKLALQIAEALEVAHEKGVIHRDLKPANIKVTPDGKVKVLDFGLAKAFSGEQADLSLSNSPTLSVAATQQGVILGTASYMSPEQARGKEVDKRADIWAFGVVLFEMLTGKQVFTGDTVSDTLASVLKSEPEWQSLTPNLHPRTRLLLERCLKKEPKNRYHDIADARVDIQEVLADPSGVFAQQVSTAEPRTKSARMMLWVSITTILVIIAGIVVWNLKTPESRRLIQLEYGLPDNQQLNLSVLGKAFLAVSPDGSQFVYSTTQGIYLRSVDRLDARRIPGSEDNSQAPFFSPDGQWIGYYSPADQKLKKLATNGGVPILLCEIKAYFAGGQWLPDNTIVFSVIPGGIMKIPDSGGTPEPLFKTDVTESTEASAVPVLPQFLPDEKNVLFTDIFDRQKLQITIQSLETGKRRALFPGQSASYLPTGHLLYGLTENNATNLFAVPFDLDRLEATGGAVSLIRGVNSYSVSKSGTFVYVPQPGAAINSDSEARSADASKPTLWWVDRYGQETQIQAPPLNYSMPKISPDGNKIALTDNLPVPAGDVWILDLVRGTLQRLTLNEGDARHAIWSPDGRRIAYASMGQIATGKGATTAIVCKAADGSGEVEYLGSSPGKILFPYSWAKDSKTILTSDVDPGFTNADIGMLSLEGDRPYRLLLKGDSSEVEPQLSPDGRWLAYVSFESGDGQVYVRPFPAVDKGGLWQISVDGGSMPRWSPDGKELYYLTGENITEAVMVVEVETEPTFNPAKPKVLFRGAFIGPAAGNGIPYDVHPDGKRFLMMKPPQGSGVESTRRGPRKINIVLNWTEELKLRVPVK